MGAWSRKARTWRVERRRWDLGGGVEDGEGEGEVEGRIELGKGGGGFAEAMAQKGQGEAGEVG
jgi:hypothetical protein